MERRLFSRWVRKSLLRWVGPAGRLVSIRAVVKFADTDSWEELAVVVRRPSERGDGLVRGTAAHAPPGGAAVVSVSGFSLDLEMVLAALFKTRPEQVWVGWKYSFEMRLVGLEVR